MGFHVYSMNRTGDRDEIVYNWYQCGKLREQVFSTFSSTNFGVKIVKT